MCVVSDEAFVAGAAAIPRPFDDAFWNGWFVWQAVSVRFEFLDATGTIMPFGQQYTIDSKSMRKVGANETVVLMYESQSGAVNLTAHMRILLKLL